MPSRRPLSMASLMILVAVMAGNFAVLRFLWEQRTYGLGIMVLPTLNLLLLGLWRMNRNPTSRPFWMAFDVVGCLMIGLIFVLDWGYHQLDWDFFMEPFVWFSRNGWISEDSPANLTIAYGCYSLIYTGPQVLAASVAGRLSDRYRVVRRYPPTTRRLGLESRSQPAGLWADRDSGDSDFEAEER